ncbi:MAG: FAD-dependent oxidoreductase [bacterium]
MPDQEKLYDVAIVGYGPAGVTAGIYVARRRLMAVLIGETPGGEVASSGEIENWPGDGETGGMELTRKFEEHLKIHEDQVDIVTHERVSKIRKVDDGFFALKMEDEKEYRAKTVIYAAGRHPRELNVPGERKFKGKGVSYCAVCDAPLFADRRVAVIGGGNTGVEAAIMLQKIASRIYLLHIGETLSADQVLVDSVKDDDKVEIIYNARTTKIGGDGLVTSLSYQDEKTGREGRLEVAGIFVSIGAVPNTDPIKDLIEMDKHGAVVTDRYGKTSVEGFFAAGDVTDIRDAQIVVAAGHGCSAALSAGDYLARKA